LENPQSGRHNVAHGESRGEKGTWKYFSSPGRGGIILMGSAEF
jgi:hypothetical protein